MKIRSIAWRCLILFLLQDCHSVEANDRGVATVRETPIRTEMHIASEVRGRNIDSKISDQDLDGIPKWNLEQNDLPISPKHASFLATRQLSRVVSDSKSWEIDGIELRRFNRSGSWFYVIRYTMLDSGDVSQISYVNIIVLFNGKVIAPKGR